MLFQYKYLEDHPIEKLQEYLDFVFLEVWCKANGEFGIEKFDGCPELKAIIKAIFYDDSISVPHLYEPIQEAFNIFKNLDSKFIDQLKVWYKNNNDIEKLCSGDKTCQPISYKELKTIHQQEELSKLLNKFYKNLYKNVLGLKAVYSQFGKLGEHYQQFVELNDEDICPFCGITDIKGQYHSKREAYDHFLPKDFYPFNSVNFKNLAPMCTNCNTSYKLQQDPLYEIPKTRDPLFDRDNRRRKVFYPFTIISPEITISVEIKTKEIDKLKPDKLNIHATSSQHTEEITTWKEVFGIDERFKAKCCSKNGGLYWYQQAVDEIDNVEEGDKNEALKKWLAKIKRAASTKPWAENNFIKAPFLDGCEVAGVFTDKISSI